MIQNTNKKRSYFIRLLQGEISLSITFWLWYVFLSFLINILIDYSINESFIIYLYIIIFLYSIFIFISVQRSASKYIGNKLWSFLAKLIISINLLFTLFTSYELLKINFLEDYAIKNEINNLKDSLPLKVDSFSYLIDININDKSIYYIYQLNDIDIKKKFNINKFKSQVQNSLCENENTLKLLKKDYILDYLYIDKDKNEITKIQTNKNKCGKSIYDIEILKEILKNE